jgi:hypothetical protein
VSEAHVAKFGECAKQETVIKRCIPEDKNHSEWKLFFPINNVPQLIWYKWPYHRNKSAYEYGEAN